MALPQAIKIKFRTLENYIGVRGLGRETDMKRVAGLPLMQVEQNKNRKRNLMKVDAQYRTTKAEEKRIFQLKRS